MQQPRQSLPHDISIPCLTRCKPPARVQTCEQNRLTERRCRTETNAPNLCCHGAQDGPPDHCHKEEREEPRMMGWKRRCDAGVRLPLVHGRGARRSPRAHHTRRWTSGVVPLIETSPIESRQASMTGLYSVCTGNLRTKHVNTAYWRRHRPLPSSRTNFHRNDEPQLP